ncbi:NAD-dependent DNA ligase [Clostridium tyrobutyricum]|uniref:NAD-dependent DNA ligase n=1 Tax=Clostridium tyrobutyricum TaxID=1519 RepID=UPI0010AA2D4F|nr:NAD-dependent DNA ligase [Clostridium tyrobutyricum]QCH27824.1 hypothetical protein EZN00_01422 [Clostridium tyrobutyricum]
MDKTKIVQNIIVNLKGITSSLENLVKTLNESADSEETEQKKNTKEIEQKQPTLEEVRAAMAEKNREGHREEVKAILVKYDANKLTALDPEHYVEVLKKVGEIK